MTYTKIFIQDGINQTTILFWLVSLLLLLQGCGSGNRSKDEAGRQTSSNSKAIATLFRDTVDVMYAKNFHVSYRKNYKIVRTSSTVGDWEQGGETRDLEDVMVLVPEGQKPPLLEGELAGAIVISIPAGARVATNSSGIEIWLDMLGLKEANTIRAVAK